MKIAGIVTEYNPFHQGHIHHITLTRRITDCDVLIAVMSGNFVQRGEPAVIDKWQRTEAALTHGVDLVIELPFAYAVQSAKQFAEASIGILALAGVTDIVFGSETNNLEELKEFAAMPINVNAFKEKMKSGAGYPAAYGLSTASYFPNDILGIAYLKAMEGTDIIPHTIQRTNSYHDTAMDSEFASASLKAMEGTDIIPHTIQRTNSYHDTAMDSEFASASALRHAHFNQLPLNGQTPLESALATYPTIDWQAYYPALRLKLLTTDKETLSRLFLFDEGIENHLVKQAMNSDTWEIFLNRAVTRRYTKARIQRSCTHALVHTRKEEINGLSNYPYLRVLGFNQIGREYLKHLQTNEVKVASRFNQIPEAIRKLEFRSTLVYASALPPELRNQLIKREIQGPIIIEKKD